MSKFDNVGNDPETTILFQTPAKFGEYDTLYQKWFWDGITAESLIFVTDDIKNITMDALEGDIRKSEMVTGSKDITTNRDKSEYTFFNFNFVMDDD